MLILLFRVIVFIMLIPYGARRWGDWQNRGKYYSTVLFCMFVNLCASHITYHYSLWNYQADALIQTQTVAEIINCFIVLPSVTFLYLSKYPEGKKIHQFGYVTLWVLFFSSIEYIDHYLIGGIYYSNGWSWHASTVFDFALFAILRIHYLNPSRAWQITLVLTAVILAAFNFGLAEMK